MNQLRRLFPSSSEPEQPRLSSSIRLEGRWFVRSFVRLCVCHFFPHSFGFFSSNSSLFLSFLSFLSGYLSSASIPLTMNKKKFENCGQYVCFYFSTRFLHNETHSLNSYRLYKVHDGCDDASWVNFVNTFFDASLHLCKSVCPSVGPSVRPLVSKALTSDKKRQ